jgi:hypothetical protein
MRYSHKKKLVATEKYCSGHDGLIRLPGNPLISRVRTRGIAGIACGGDLPPLEGQREFLNWANVPQAHTAVKDGKTQGY